MYFGRSALDFGDVGQPDVQLRVVRRQLQRLGVELVRLVVVAGVEPFVAAFPQQSGQAAPGVVVLRLGLHCSAQQLLGQVPLAAAVMDFGQQQLRRDVVGFLVEDAPGFVARRDLLLIAEQGLSQLQPQIEVVRAGFDRLLVQADGGLGLVGASVVVEHAATQPGALLFQSGRGRFFRSASRQGLEERGPRFRRLRPMLLRFVRDGEIAQDGVERPQVGPGLQLEAHGLPVAGRCRPVALGSGGLR